jgi:hypothetical protein
MSADVVAFLRSCNACITPFVGTALALFSHISRGDASTVAPYCSMFPEEDSDCLMYWSPEEKLELKGEATSCSTLLSSP